MAQISAEAETNFLDTASSKSCYDVSNDQCRNCDDNKLMRYGSYGHGEQYELEVQKLENNSEDCGWMLIFLSWVIIGTRVLIQWPKQMFFIATRKVGSLNIEFQIRVS